MIGAEETRPLDWEAGRVARPIPAPRSRGLVFLARPAPADEEAARLADALSRVAHEEARRPDESAGLASRDGVSGADADPDGRLRVPALPIFPVELGIVPPADAVREWLRTSTAGPYDGGPLLLMPIFPSARIWELPIDPYLDLGADLAQAGHAVHLLPVVAATRLGSPGDVNVGFAERDTDRLRFEGVAFVLGVRSAEAVDFDNLARETHLVAWQLAALPTAERARLLDDFGGEAVARARRLIHPTTSLRYVASCELAARSLDVTLGVVESQDGAGSSEADAAPAGISAAQAFAEGRRLVAEAAASLTPDQVSAAVAERR
ncbi:MAG: hypothetical protein M3O34_15460, partial [Chloroflexota bacterium]|nr:hypothetical protein [Chloroflexota bacterium]